jgi:hypothetical protein
MKQGRWKPKMKIGQHVWLVSPIIEKSTGSPAGYTVGEYRVLSFDKKMAVVVHYWDDEHPFEVIDICIHSIFAKIDELFVDEATAKAHAEREKALLGIPQSPF